MLDILWQRGERDAAIRLEQLWNELAKLESFSRFCAYRMDPLDSGVYGGAVESACKVHTHLIPARDYAQRDDAVQNASAEVLDDSAAMLSSLSASRRPFVRLRTFCELLYFLDHRRWHELRAGGRFPRPGSAAPQDLHLGAANVDCEDPLRRRLRRHRRAAALAGGSAAAGAAQAVPRSGIKKPASAGRTPSGRIRPDRLSFGAARPRARAL